MLKESNFIDDVVVNDAQVGKELVVVINSPEENARIISIERLSKPGRRVYAKASEIPSFKQGRGVVVVSTSHGVMTGQEAKSKRLGGELMFKVS